MGNQSSSTEEVLTEQVIHQIRQKADLFQASNLATVIHDFKATFEGEVITPMDLEAYNKARSRPWNLDQRKFPLLILRPSTTESVAKAVQFIQLHRQDRKICIACGCHSSRCMLEDSMVIDLFLLNSSSVNVSEKIVSVGGGAYLKVIDDALVAHNLAVTVGTYPETGVGGLTLAGGYGWLARKYGLTVDNFLEAEVVLANGTIVIANDENEFSDLMWGLRGGGGNFGIVTKFTFRVHELPKSCFGGDVVYLAPNLSARKAIVKQFDVLNSNVPDEVTGAIVFPAGAPVVPTTWAYVGDAETPQDVPVLVQATKMGTWTTPIVSKTIKKMSYHKDLQTMLTPHQTGGHIYQTVVPFGEEDKPLPEELIEKLLDFTAKAAPSQLQKAAVVAMKMGGAAGKMDGNNEKTCIPQPIRRARYFAIIEAYWKPELGDEGKEVARTWARTAFSILAPYKPGEMRYAPDEVNTGNTPAEAAFQGEGVAGYTIDLHSKLGQLKAKYDPENFFRENVNILPQK